MRPSTFRLSPSAFFILHSAFFLLSLAFLASCQPASPSPNHSITQSPNPTITKSPITQSPTPTSYPLSPYPLSSILSPELQQTLQTRQGWTIKWDAARGVYAITQRRWDENQAAFTASTLGEVGYIDREGNLHLYTTSFSAEPGQESAFVASQTNSEITISLNSSSVNSEATATATATQTSTPTATPEATATFEAFATVTATVTPKATATKTPTPTVTPEATATATTTPTATPEATATANPQENNATETALGPFTFIETKNPLFEKTGILKFTDENGVTYVYSAPSAQTSERQINGKTVKVVEFASLEKNEQGVMAMTLDTLHTGFPVAWLIANGYDKPFMKLDENGNLVSDDEIIKTPPQYSIQFNLVNGTKVAFLRSRSLDLSRYLRLIKNKEGNVMYFFVTDGQSGKTFFTLPLQMFNPSDYQHPEADDRMFLFGTFGTMNKKQLVKFQATYPTDVLGGEYLEKLINHPAFVIFLAQENGYFEKNAGAWDGYFDQRPLDQLLGMEGNDVRNNNVIMPDGYKFNLGDLIDYGNKQVEKEPKHVFELVIYDNNGIIIPFRFDGLMQRDFFGLGF